MLAVVLLTRATEAAAGCAAPLGQGQSVSMLLGPAGDHLNDPSSVNYHPITGELYVTDRANESFAAFNFSTNPPTAKYYRDRASYHYMTTVSALSFDPLGQFATCQESLNNYRGQMLPNFFMGPTLYGAIEPSTNTLVNSKQEPCLPGETCFIIHIDMLHEAPLCMGIAHDNGVAVVRGGMSYKNVYWTYDGGSRQLVRFDFESDHGPGSMDHSLASVRRYTGLLLHRVDSVPSHMVVDSSTRELFVADAGADRLVIVQVDTGYFGYDAKPTWPIFSSPSSNFIYSVWHGINYTVAASIPRASGVAITSTTLYVSSYASGMIYAYDRATGRIAQMVAVAAANSVSGLTLSPQGALVFVDQTEKTVKRIDVTTPCSSVGVGSGHCVNGAKDSDETGVDCGGSSCVRCAEGQMCASGNDCSSGTCGGSGLCIAQARTIQTNQYLWSYLDSDFYRNSFAHHMIHGDMGAASYMNPYPIMESGFCDTVGMVRHNYSLVNGSIEHVGEGVNLTEPDCSLVDYDSLLLGGCWCHKCLPENPCQGGGKCVNYNLQGYTCDCDGTGRSGDHCQLQDGQAVDFPWYSMPGGKKDDDSNDDWVIPVAIGAGVVGLLVIGGAVVMLGKGGGGGGGRTANNVKCTGTTMSTSTAPPVSHSVPPSPPGSEYPSPPGSEYEGRTDGAADDAAEGWARKHAWQEQ